MKSWELRCREWIQKGKLLLQDEKKRVNLLLSVGLAGLLLMALSEWLPEEKNTASEVQDPVLTELESDYALQLEERLQALISHMEGVGKVEVMVTLASGEESVYATDNQTQADGSMSTNHVLLGNDGLVQTVQSPRVLGVAVLCEGGGEAAVQNRVSTLVESLTGIGANHITVDKMTATD